MQVFLPNSPKIVHFETKNPALGIGRAMVLCNNTELVNPCKARPRRNAHARPKEHALLNLLWFLLFPSRRRQGGTHPP